MFSTSFTRFLIQCDKDEGYKIQHKTNIIKVLDEAGEIVWSARIYLLFTHSKAIRRKLRTLCTYKCIFFSICKWWSLKYITIIYIYTITHLLESRPKICIREVFTQCIHVILFIYVYVTCQANKGKLVEITLNNIIKAACLFSTSFGLVVDTK